MPRQLPWDNSAVPPSRTRTPTTSSTRVERPAKRLKKEDAKDDEDATGVPARSRQLKRDSSRTPSTSPPPTPPLQEPMKPSDEAWIMVEDEFYTVAQSFTKHLHWSEYKRLKERAAKKGADLAVIDRPTDGRTEMSEAVKMQEKHESKREEMEEASQNIRAKSQALLKGAGKQKDEDSDDDEETVIDDRDLAGLMFGVNGNKKSQRTILRVTELKISNTRAAAGFKKQGPEHSKAVSSTRLYDIPGVKVEEDDTFRRGPPQISHDVDIADEEDDDLDVTAIREPKNSAVVPERRRASQITPVIIAPPIKMESTTNSSKLKEMPTHRGISATTVPSSTSISISKPKIKQVYDTKPLNLDGFPQSRALSSGLLQRSRAKGLLKQPREETIVKLEEIPTFLV